MLSDQQSICAVSTPPGTGAIAILRISGDDSIVIADKIFRSVVPDKKLIDQKGNSAHYGSVISDDEIIDDVIVTVFHKPNSFSGENTVEISCHGSTFIQQKILQLIIKNGARMALPGEFTQRAFLNGKMDLSQAEAIADLISASTSAAHSLAMKQMKGGVSKEINQLRDQLLNFISLVELELDFSEEDVEFANRESLLELTIKIHRLINKLANSFQYGNAVKNGIPVAIIGDTNVGKSTLLNILLNEEKAIVSDIAGTTRDVIEDTMTIDGIQFRFIDTAGIRATTDTIENLGIERSFEKIRQASIVLVMIDSRSGYEQIREFIEKVRNHLEGKNAALVINKIDKVDDDQLNHVEIISDEYSIPYIPISAKKDINIDQLTNYLTQTVKASNSAENDVVITNLRHHEALTNAGESINRVIDGIEKKISGDFLAQDIRECLYFLGSITGNISNDEVLGNIFKNFCIGK
jgi:tRNA modification GTPase